MPLYAAFLHNIELVGYRIEIQFDNNILDVKQNIYANKIINAYIVYNLDTWPKIPLNNFEFLKKCLLGLTYIVKNSDKDK